MIQEQCFQIREIVEYPVGQVGKIVTLQCHCFQFGQTFEYVAGEALYVV